MLPRPYRLRIPDADRLAGDQRFDRVRNNSILRPVSPADRVSRTHRSQFDSVRAQSIRREERRSIRLRNVFSRSLAGAVRIASAQRVAFLMPPPGRAILIALVARYDNHD